MSDLQMWELIVGFLSATLVLPMIQQPHWSSRRRCLVTVVYSIVAGLVTAYLTGAFAGVHDVHAAISSVLWTLLSAIGFYKGVGQPSGISPAIENATSAPEPVR